MDPLGRLHQFARCLTSRMRDAVRRSLWPLVGKAPLKTLENNEHLNA